MRPGPTDRVAEGRTTSSIGSSYTRRGCNNDNDRRRLAQNGLSRCGGGWGSGCRGDDWDGSGDGGSSSAAALASVGDGAVSIGSTAVSISRTASAEGTLGITRGSSEVLSTTAVSARGSRGGRSNRGSGRGCDTASGETSSTAVVGSVSTPSILTAA